MSALLADTSVLLKWFQSEREGEVQAAKALREAHFREQITVHILDLALYEFGNALLRGFRLTAAEATAQLEDLITIVGPPIAFAVPWLGVAARLGEEHGLTYYHAAWAAAAEELRIPLVSADQRLLHAELAESATNAANRLGLEA